MQGPASWIQGLPVVPTASTIKPLALREPSFSFGVHRGLRPRGSWGGRPCSSGERWYVVTQDQGNSEGPGGLGPAQDQAAT